MGFEAPSGRLCLLVTALVGWLVLGGACGGDGRSVRPRSAAAPTRRTANTTGGATRYAVTVGGVALQVEVAATPQERRRGLSRRPEVASGTGMLFVFPDEARRTFWMKDTPAPLSLAFLDGEGYITQMEDMVPLSETPHTSYAPVRYVLEVPRGWFREMGVEVGDRIVFGEALEKHLRELGFGEPTSPSACLILERQSVRIVCPLAGHARGPADMSVCWAPLARWLLPDV